MKRQVVLLLVAIALLSLVLVYRKKERACPLAAKAIANDPVVVTECTDQGGVVKDGVCTCPE